MNFFKKAIIFLKEAKEELKKVSWPSKKETWQKTLIVISFSLIVALILGLFDATLTLILRKIIE